MAVTIHENPHPSSKLRHYTIKINHTHSISTTVTSHPGAARDWIHRTLHQHRHNRHRLIVGIGVQWTPSKHYHNHSAATIQLCIGRRCLIFQLHHSLSSPRILRRLLLDPRNTFVGLWCHSDAKMLLECDHKLEMVSDMPINARVHVVGSCGRSLKGDSIAEITKEVIGVDIDWDADVGKSDWEVEELGFDQIRQACVDAFVAFAIGMRISAWNFNSFV